MLQAILRIASENYYSCELTRKIPVRVHLITINGPEGFGIIESLDGSERPLKKYSQFMKNSENIIEFEITYHSEKQYWTRAVHQIDGASIHQTVLDSGCMTKLPIIIAKGVQTHVILAPSQEEFSRLYNDLKEKFSSVDLVKLHRYPDGVSTSILSIKQEEAFRLAYSRGYFEIPRACDIQHLAEEIGIKRVAFQERLRRAEKKIMSEFAKTAGM